ncbi:hypothetical protein [Acetobacter ascendens]|uniref:hypothetical protein n=1 Tax=Acetobacter ascendens TaxID=481146 RepID=UPI000875D780|nr:hypothetical protein [Acetobacter ascendens]AOW49447.1 hypothetical protein A4R89_08460 [Acetobacter ascendens]
MPTGQLTLNGVDDAQLEQLLDVKKNNELNIQLIGLQLMPNGNPPPPYPFHPNVPPPFPAPPPGSSRYNVTLSWVNPQGFSAISQIVQKISQTP